MGCGTLLNYWGLCVCVCVCVCVCACVCVCVCVSVRERERENCAVLHRHLLNSQLIVTQSLIFTAGKERIVKNLTKE